MMKNAFIVRRKKKPSKCLNPPIGTSNYKQTLLPSKNIENEHLNLDKITHFQNQNENTENLS